jgi:glycosyltransferase involved in cell wall biosynthesis
MCTTILHSHTIVPGGLAGAFIKKELGIPHVCTIHGSDINVFPYQNKIALLLTKYSLRGCDHVIGVSSKTSERAHSIANGAAKISIIYNGADSELFRPLQKEATREKLGLAREKKILLYVGNILRLKGVHTLIEAFAALLKDYKRNDMLLLLIGEGSERRGIEHVVKALKIENEVLLLGEKPHDEIPLWVNSADVFVLPSLSEGFPLVIPEAMMCGVPVVATDVGGVPEAVIDGRTGLLVRPNDAFSLEKAIRAYLDNEQFTRRITENARRMAENFTWAINAEKNLALYSTLLNL